MSVEQMRAILKAKYSGTTKFDNMSDAQIRAIYNRQLNAGNLRGVTVNG